ncbi:UvrD-helicase domain-containing protein [Bifidobacterium catulorum]|nr:UvrD-helicase domain-containing protein [Bifidobacterium catulorum]
MTPEPLLPQEMRDMVNHVVGKVEGHPLSDEQLSAIAGAGNNTLVLAGAGTGKTTTICGYVSWLVKSGEAKPGEILVLSFTKASADEMSGRIRKETGEDIRACTFHSLGLRICKGSTAANITVPSESAIREALQTAFDEAMGTDSRYRRLALSMMPEGIVKGNEAWDGTPMFSKPTLRYAYHQYCGHLIDTAWTIIQHMRGNDMDLAAMERMNRERGGENVGRNRDMLRIIKPLFEAYERYLHDGGYIDFPGMISQATRCVEDGSYDSPYRYILIDEYQDLSMPRYELVCALRRRRDCALFCVGDDWQSIYRFAGSDIRFILDFAQVWSEWGSSRMFQITTTRRFKNSLIEASGEFVMADGHLYEKHLRATNNTKDHSLKALGGSDAEERLDSIITQLGKLPKNASVLFLGRYRSDENLLFGGQSAFGALSKNGRAIALSTRPDLTMEFRTVHAAKGLQSDFVFLLCCSGGLHGFPSAIAEEPLLGLLLPEVGEYPYAEERRLFYVAMTRCRKKLFFIVDKAHPSRFMYELRDHICPNIFRGVTLPPQCPVCGEALMQRTWGDSRFWGCSAYPNCTYTKQIAASKATRRRR